MTTAPYGSWPSPITVEMLTADTVRLSAPQVDGTDVYWLEARAEDGGRSSLWQRSSSGALVQLTPAPFNVRSRVNEYGGGEYAVADGIAVFSHFADGRVYRVGPGAQPEPITPELDLRFADLRLHPGAGLVLAVREDHRGEGEAVTTLVRLDLDSDNADGGTVLATGADFYASPELAADGRLAWVEWNHPAMPWDATAIKVGRLTEGGLANVRSVAGGPTESAIHPRWTPGGRLIFCSDRTDWWNLYVLDADLASVSPVLERSAEFTDPPWQLGAQPYAVVDEDRLVTTVLEDGTGRLAELRLSTGALTTLSEGTATAVNGDRGLIAAVLRTPDSPTRLVIRELSDESWTAVRVASELPLAPEAISVPEAVSWSGEQGEVHGWYYPPTNTDRHGDAGALPPLRVEIHGGPTAMALNSFALGYQFWTSRGFAILDVNYGGSTGYGRTYRDRLKGTWGVVDVADCISGALAMAEQGRADATKLVITGGSAGGYTTLRALTVSDVFAAGISYYGVGDLESLARDTHKFESRYLDALVGPYPAEAELYRDRSPIHHVDDLASPILLLQGADDAVVPLNQAEEMAAAARAKGLPVALVVFPGEGHGFRRAENIQTSVRAELAFLGRVLGFEPADQLPELEIDNLP